MHLLSSRNGFQHPVPSDITPLSVYQDRRTLLRAMAGGVAGAALASWAQRDALAQAARPGKHAPLPGVPSAVPGATTVEKLTSYQDASSYNNFYEFGTDKADPARGSWWGMKRVPSGRRRIPPSPRTASEIRKDLACG